MPPPRSRGLGYNTGVASVRPSPNTPMSERQQLALLMQMTAPTSDMNRCHSKQADPKRPDCLEDNPGEKVESYEQSKDKHCTEDIIMERTNYAPDHHMISVNAQLSTTSKRCFSDIEEDDLDESDDLKKKKRKEMEISKDFKNANNSRLPVRFEKSLKQTGVPKHCPISNKGSVLEKEPLENKCFDLESSEEDIKGNDNFYSEGLKVPPLKIVIPQQNCSMDTDGLISRSGKISTSRSALPYVVSSNNESGDKDCLTESISPNASPVKINALATLDDKSFKLLNEEKNLQRVLRSSNRTGALSAERSSNNSSPQMQSSCPSPASYLAAESSEGKLSLSNIANSPLLSSSGYENDITNLPSPSTSSTSSSKETNSNLVELHPRKRKIKKTDENNIKSGINPGTETTAITSQLSNPHDLPFINGYQMFLTIRKQITRKWKSLYAVKPRPPQGYQDYLINKRSYLLFGKDKSQDYTVPVNIPVKMKEVFLVQENDRHELAQRQTVEREKLCLSVEQEILRVHSKAARNISCQPAPFSVCTIIKDEEVYNLLAPEVDDKDRSARYRFNGRLLLSWLQDVDDKWEKIKESMVLRHHNEAESLHAVQLMDWEIALKKFGLCDFKYQMQISKDHVPMVKVSDDFDLLPA